MESRAKIWVVTAILLAMVLTALDMTIVGTAMPSIIRDLHGVTIYSWVFSAYLLTSTTPVPVYSKLADMYGRKPLFIAGASIFTAGSVLCGSADSMTQLIIYRAIQGLGAAGVLPIALTIVGDIFTLEQRSRVQGLFSAVWGVSAVIGPLLGAWIVQNTSWRWVFNINLPIGIVVLGILIFAFKEKMERHPHRVDWLGTFSLSIGVTLGLVALIQNQWGLTARIGVGLISLAILAIFGWWETKAQEPIVPFVLYRDRFILFGTSVNLFAGMVMFGLISYMPLYVQAVKAGSPTAAGQAITPMLVGWPLAAFLIGPLVKRFSYRNVALLGGALLVLGSILIIHNASLPEWSLVVGMFLIGAGMGFSLTGLLIGLQSSVPWNMRGVVTGSTQFFRTIGGSIGVAVMGSVFNSVLATGAKTHPLLQGYPGASITQILLTPRMRGHLPANVLSLMTHIVQKALYDVFLLSLLFAMVGFLAIVAIPKRSVVVDSPRSGTDEDADDMAVDE